MGWFTSSIIPISFLGNGNFSCPLPIEFNRGEYKVPCPFQKPLNQIAKFLYKQSACKFLIEGHTDSDGSDEFNLKLSYLRAESVKNELVHRGISPKKIVIWGYGEKFPLKGNTNISDEEKQQNRRVVISLMNCSKN